jgi:hypothetical protein
MRMTVHGAQEDPDPCVEKSIWKGSELVGEWEIYCDGEVTVVFWEDSTSSLEESAFYEAMGSACGLDCPDLFLVIGALVILVFEGAERVSAF